MKKTDIIYFTAVVKIPITVQEANIILTGPDPSKDMTEWLQNSPGFTCISSDYEIAELKKSYSEALLNATLEEAKQLEYQV